MAAVDRNAPVPVPVEGCWAVGYPLFQEVRSAVGVVRETAQVWGMILPAENLVSGLLSLQVTSAPRALPPEQETLGQSQWSGMSGAAVVAGERLIGVVSEHAPRRGKSTITVEAAGGILDPLTQRLQTALAQLRQVPEDLGEVYELVYAFIRKGGKLPVYARWIEGEEART